MIKNSKLKSTKKKQKKKYETIKKKTWTFRRVNPIHY